MKKIVLIVLMLPIMTATFAQQIDGPLLLSPDAKVNVDVSAMKGFAETGWFIPSWDLFDNFYAGDYSYVTHYANLVFPDSIVKYEGSTGTISYNWLCGVGQVLDPYSEMFFTPLTEYQSYRIDSLFVLAWYNMVNSSVVDTLVAEFVIGEPLTSPQFAHTIYIFDPDTLDVSPPKMMGDTTQKGYYAKLTAPDKIIVKYPLTMQDTTMLYGKYIQFPVGIEVPMGKVVGVSISFVPGYDYVYDNVLYSYMSGGTLTQEINAFRVGLYSVNNTEDYPSLFYDPYGYFNLSFYIHKSGRYKMYADSWRNERMASLITWGFDIGWKLSGSDNVSVDEMNSVVARVYPNPAQDIVSIDLPAKESIVNVYSLHGALLFSKHTDTSTLQINVSDWTSGMYIVEIISGNTTNRLKFVK